MTLSQVDAQYRSSLITKQSILYKINLFLKPGTGYTVHTELSFQLMKIPDENRSLFLDCICNNSTKTINNFSINDNKIQQEQIKHETETGKLSLNTQKLSIGLNYVVVSYDNLYDNDGCGLVSFVDVDEKQYLYTQFQAFHANQVFACFDQPDLKAKMQLNVVCPYQWRKVLSNQYPKMDEVFNPQILLSAENSHNIKCKQQLTRFYKLVQEQIKSNDSCTKWRMVTFPETKLLPTYLYCLIVGFYSEIILEENNRYNNIPMSLYCIESLYPHLQKLSKFIFQTTIECMRFYEKFFGVPYSFNKFDQAFVHDFKSCAMENAGIVTLNDQYIFREKVSEEKMLDLANSITHQLAHHWFGNLATMKWWDDIWLNQSFAEFISYLALEKIQHNLKEFKFESSMAAFFARKTWGYDDDQAVTTHPIRGQVSTTDVADSIFDGITYAKGASTMKQLLLLMGQQNYSAALKDYFTEYAFKNATLDDFINSLQKHFTFKQFDLNDWKKLWLETASLNNLEPSWLNQNHILIEQTFYDQKYSTLRPHKMKIALFKQDSSYDVIEVLVNAAPKTQIQYQNKQYKAMMLNYEDHTFAKMILDVQSLQFFSKNITKISDILTRTLLWRNFYDLVKDAKISSRQYIQMFLKNIQTEPSDSVLQRNYQYIENSIRLYTPEKYRQQFLSQIFDFTHKFLNHEKNKQNNSNRLVILKENLIRFANNQKNALTLLDLLKNNRQEYGISLQWEIIVKIFMCPEIDVKIKEQILEQQKKIDNGDTAKQQSQTCSALIANDKQFKQLYQSYKTNTKSVTMKRKSMRGWNNVIHQEKLIKNNYKLKYFEDLMQVNKYLEGDHFLSFMNNLGPKDDNFTQNIELYKKVELNGEKFEKARKKILRIIDDYERRSKCYQKFIGVNNNKQ